MYRDYDIFEVLPNGSKVSIARMPSLELALLRLERLARFTSNECFVAEAETRQVIAHRNVPSAKDQVIKRIFQIVYDEELGIQRAELLRSLGYHVISVVGNEKAKILLSAIHRYDFFIVGSTAPEETRSEIVSWLKAYYPNVKILALNPPQQRQAHADYNASQNGPWLAIVTQQLG